MNRSALRKNLYSRVRIRPIAKRYNGDMELQRLDHDWIIERVDDAGVLVRNIRTKHVTTLGYDHIHHFTTDPDRSMQGIAFGFLTLNIQVHIGDGNRLWVEPTPRPAGAI